MRDMFYNYEHNINHKEYTSSVPYLDKDELESYTCVKKLLNANGDEIGILAKENSKFYLYFNFQVDCGLPIQDMLAEGKLFFEVLDFKREVIAGPELFNVELSDYTNTARVELSTSASGPLKYGVYRMHLYAKVKDKIYTLFSEEDGILNIS